MFIQMVLLKFVCDYTPHMVAQCTSLHPLADYSLVYTFLNMTTLICTYMFRLMFKVMFKHEFTNDYTQV